MSDSIDPARWLSDELANRDKRIEDLETRLHTSREIAAEGWRRIAELERRIEEARQEPAQPEHDAEVEAIVERELAAWHDTGARDDVTTPEEMERHLRRAVQAGREPLLKRIEELRAGWVSASDREIAMAEHESRQAQRIEQLEQNVAEWRSLHEGSSEALRLATSALADAKAEGAREAHEVFDAVLDYEESLLPRKDDRTIYADGEASMVERVRKTLKFVRGGGRLRPRGDQ
jgi:flagellar biosynthesis GTPase FlhF